MDEVIGSDPAICPRCDGWGNHFNQADEIYVACGLCNETGRLATPSQEEPND